MKCKCGGETRVIDVRLVVDKLRRRRSCMECGARFNTFEIHEDAIKEMQAPSPEPNESAKETPKPNKNPIYVSEKTVEKINEKKKKARHLIEDMKYWEKQENEDLFWNGDYQDDYSTY